MTQACVLVVEDDAELREALCDTLDLAGYRFKAVDSAEAALTLLQAESVDMVVSDVNMGGMDGHALLAKIKQLKPALPVLLITAYGAVDRAVDAIRMGAVDYLLKPFEPDQLLAIVERYAASRLLLRGGSEPIAESASAKQLLQLAQRVAATDSTVLIMGESGTGKEVLAQYIHRHSPRAEMPFVALNCAAIPENMLEATLFGHEKGAFTGAYSSMPGKFEQADGGTLLLDEVSEMAVGLQAKLLRVLQEQEVERIGGRKVIKLDVRVLATTNRDLGKEVAEGRFREDLYYRLNIFPLHWSALRERPEDLIPLAERLLHKHAGKMNRGGVALAASAHAVLLGHDWPGNVRELENVMQRALILQQGPQIVAADLCLDSRSMQASTLTVPVQSAVESAAPQLGDDMRQHEYQLIIDALRAHRGSRKEASVQLGISPRTLRYKLAQMRDSGIDVDGLLKA
ncbi:MAG: two-component system response regulator FlrC [Motiliproteus sp.]|jgi:two-component system response regulator FlrC